MKKTLFFAVILSVISTATALGQNSKMVALDTIFKVEGKVMPVDVTSITSKYVSFTVPGSGDVYTIDRKEVHKIIYKNGKVEEYNKPIFIEIDENAYKAVWLTDDEKDVAGMYKRQSIKAESPSSSRSPKAAKKNATIVAQKRAAALKGQVIHVTKRQATGGYGDFPGYIIEGMVYGYEPLDEDGEIATQNSGTF